MSSRERKVLERTRSEPAANSSPIVPVWIVCTALAWVTSATAQSADDPHVEARSLGQQAMQAFRDEDYPTALALLQRSYALDPLPITLYNLGMAQRALFDFPAAVDSLREYLRVGGSDVPADRRAQIESFLTEMEAALVLVTVTVAEPGATVLVDGSEVGTSPLPAPLRLRAGAHVLEARKEGFTDARESIQTAAGDRLDVTLTLAAREVVRTTLRVTSQTPGATAAVDGVAQGSLPVEVDVSLGPHEVRVEAEGYELAALVAEAVEGQRTEVVAALVALPPPAPPTPEASSADPEEDGGIETQWWFWTIVGAVVAAGAVTAGVLLWPEEGRPGATETTWLR